MGNRYPKLVALDIDYAIFTSYLDPNKFGDRGWVNGDLRNNLELVDSHTLRDKKNHANVVHLASDIPRIIHDLDAHNVVIALVSQHPNKDLCDRALWHFKAHDKNDKTKSIIYFVKYDEVVNENKKHHFERIHGWSHFPYREMLFFDSQSRHLALEKELGLTFLFIADSKKGMTWDDYTKGLRMWRANIVEHEHK
ncbi:hypothetical protein K435DRAFT_747514 [Dendrothele bispora CBS 962.96]|uniref:Magnesium-dependent phosphatase-1 n=1 Tax=Dendrothele bispora (strain CBS 962.96) TaxID=1314807 RepID=A0A4S8MLP9_DENBC|nr:hypothetical protein K435DRAFT_747514 [Dendrothele bispora CBS 962.96]